RLQVGEAIVVADLVVKIFGAGQARLRGEVLGAARELRVVGGEHAAAAGGDGLVAIEREAADAPDGADVPPVVRAAGVARAERLGGVLDQRDAVALAR